MRPKLSLASQFLVLQLGIVLLVVFAVGGVSLAESETTFRREEGRRLMSVADSVVASETVSDAFGEAMTEPVGLEGVAANAQAVSGVRQVLIARASGELLTGPEIKSKAVLGPSRVQSGRADVVVVEDGVKTLAAHVPIFNEEQEMVGIVIVGQTYPTMWEQVASATPQLLTYLLIGGALGFLGSLLLARRVKRQTLGLEPQEITGLVEHREAMLHGIREGVIGTDTADRITLINDEAVRLLGLSSSAVGGTLYAQKLEPGVLDVLTGKTSGDDEVVLRGDRVLVLNRMPVLIRSRHKGWVTTLRDRTELTSLQRELDVSRHTTDTLRAQAHEFTNRLHTIAGLVELGDYEEVVRFITRASAARESLTREVTSRIADPALAALLIAKASLAAEQGVQLRVSETSQIDPVDDALAADLVTVVGNLVDNALDALGSGGSVDIEVRTATDDIVVTVRDSGPGVAPELVEEVFRRGYTTKAGVDGHRGLGLALTRLICTRRGGTIEVCGSTFTARMPRRTEATA